MLYDHKTVREGDSVIPGRDKKIPQWEQGAKCNDQADTCILRNKRQDQLKTPVKKGHKKVSQFERSKNCQGQAQDNEVEINFDKDGISIWAECNLCVRTEDLEAHEVSKAVKVLQQVRKAGGINS
mgnify:CR=1 FL=1